MDLLLIIFVVTLVVCAGTYFVVHRTLTSRDAAKVHDRLIGKARPEKTAAAAAQPLFFAEGDDGKNLFQRLLGKLSIDRALQKLIEQTGLSWTTGQVVLACLALTLVAFNLTWYAAPLQIRNLAFLIAPALGSTPILFLRMKRTRRTRAFESQFPDALQFIARAMRAGHAFSVSLEMLHKEYAEPLGGEFRRAFEEQNLGLPIDTALEKLGQRMPLMDVQFFVAAVVLQKRTGGNLAEILENLAGLIRERFKLRGQIRSISAHGRLSSLTLTAIPIVVGCMMWFVNRAHMMFFVEEEMGRIMAGAAVAFMVIGYLIMQRIVNIEV